MATPMSITKDINGSPSTGDKTGLAFSDLNQDCTLTQNVVTSVTVPVNNNNRMLAYFTYSGTSDVFVLPAASPTLTAPTGTVRTTLAQLKPAAREVVGGQVLQLLTTQTGVTVSISYYAIL